MRIIISGYGRMGHMVEQELQRRGIELVAASEDICSIDPELAKECVIIDFTWPDAFRANYPFIARHFKAAVVGRPAGTTSRPKFSRLSRRPERRSSMHRTSPWA